MTRSRSPQYPSLSLPQAIDMVAKLHKANRTSVISRETAAKDMGYAGLTGRSLTVIATLAQFGLIEKAGKGDIKITRRAVDILHAFSEVDRAEAILEAAFAPNLFQQLQERFPEGVPSQNALRSYLIQQEFGDVAIGPAISAYIDTITFAENANESARTGDQMPVEPDAGTRPANPDEKTVEQTTTLANPVVPSPAEMEAIARALADRPLNKVNMNIDGDVVHLSATLNYNGLLMIEKKIKNLKALMAPDDTDEVPIEDDLAN